MSLNCAAGSTEAAAEAFQQDADIVLLQEVSSRTEFGKVANRHGYEQLVWSVDDAVYLRPSPSLGLRGNPVSGRDFAACKIFIEGSTWRVISLRLAPPVFRLDWWNPDCWREYAEDAKKRRQRIGAIRMEAGPLDNQTNELIAGDFNTTHLGISDLSDVARKAGRGWMGTGTNDFPLARVDQLWSSNHLNWHQAFVLKTKNSDHRMLVADFEVGHF
ncbi:MAG: endonuclease/exonuclease/phosphatase family protein [Fimbriimonadaceae bacterium]